MNKIVLCILGIPSGFFAGIYCGVLLERAILGPGSGNHMSMSGLAGAFIGAPVGAVAGGLLGLCLGVLCDRLGGRALWMAQVKRIGIAATIGTGVGLLLWFYAQSSFALIVSAWLGCLGGCLSNALAKVRPTNKRRSHNRRVRIPDGAAW